MKPQLFTNARIVDPSRSMDEIGGLIVFLAGDTSSFITGASITIDGGWTVQ